MLKVAAKPTPTWRRLPAIAAALAIVVLIVAGALLMRGGAPAVRVVEYAMSDPHDAPMAIAAAADGTIWFTIDQAESIGRVRGGRIDRLQTPGRNFEPLGLAVAVDGSAWYTDIDRGAVMHISPAGEVSRFSLDSAIVRLGRLAIGPDGSVWVADITGGGITSLKEGTFTQHEIGSGDGGPYGVAVASDGVVWATLQGDGKLVRIDPGGTPITIDLPRPGAVPTDIAVGADGSVWFLQFRANRIGRWRDERSGSEWCAVRALAACAMARSKPSGFRVTTPALTAWLPIPRAISGMPTSAAMLACCRPNMPALRSHMKRAIRGIENLGTNAS
jgi:virginiamycin B lyase